MLSDDQRTVVNSIIDDCEWANEHPTNGLELLDLADSIKERLELIQGYEKIPVIPPHFFDGKRGWDEEDEEDEDEE